MAIYKNELARMLGYSRWRNIQQIISRHPELADKLKENDYNKVAKFLTPAQGLIIATYLYTAQ
ncbi:MAG: DUF4248 domain-containing protein [Salinivirgaceae bacterium]|nr:DUF4248 domain-containing protein [Salinivirgaceae bacterium]